MARAKALGVTGFQGEERQQDQPGERIERFAGRPDEEIRRSIGNEQGKKDALERGRHDAMRCRRP